MTERGKRGRLRRVAVLAAVLLFGWAAYGAFYRGPAPSVVVSAERPAIGAPTRVSALFREPRRGLVSVSLMLVQGEHEEELASRTAAVPPSPWRFWSAGDTPEIELSAVIGRGQPDWLEEGTVTLRAVALRATGPLRRTSSVIVEQQLPVRLRPPSLELLSSGNYARQGGAGVVRFRTGATAVRSGVVAGSAEFLSFPVPGGGPEERFALYGIPWDLDDAAEVRLFAEDDAGNRAEAPFLDRLVPHPPRRDTIRLTDSFLARVVPAIESQTPELSGEGALIDRYLAINRDLRARNRAAIAALSRRSAARRFWSGRFLQLPGSQRKAGFAEVRSYLYRGREVDRQTHLGLDVASVRRAEVPAPNAGRVLFAGYLGIYGNAVVLDHGYGLLSLSAHLSSIAVEEGEEVAKGQVIGRTGATGLAGGDHLHLGLFVQGTAVDPMEWLDERWITTHIAGRLPE